MFKTRLAVLALLLGVLCGSCAYGADVGVGVLIDEAHFPDKNFREIEVRTYDKDGDGWLSDEEIGKVISLYISSSTKCSSLKVLSTLRRWKDSKWKTMS